MWAPASADHLQDSTNRDRRCHSRHPVFPLPSRSYRLAAAQHLKTYPPSAPVTYLLIPAALSPSHRSGHLRYSRQQSSTVRTLPSITPSAEQLKILTDAAPGFRLIRGAAGSGKTTSALLRLRQLCESRRRRRARQASSDPVRVLVITFNRTLKGYIAELASSQITPTNDTFLTISTFSRWAWQLVGRPTVLKDNGQSLILPLLQSIGIPDEHTIYFTDEVHYINGRFSPELRPNYLSATRTGRGRTPAVPRNLREKLLKNVVEPYEKTKAAHRIWDWNDVALGACKVPSQQYDIVIVDETQDLSANQVRAIYTHLSTDHTTTFIIDAVQRIYPQGFPWTEVGLTIRPGMVHTLQRNHRNTVAIARLAHSLVHDLPPDTDGILPDHNACSISGDIPQVVEGKYGSQLNYMLSVAQPHLATGETVAILQPRGGRWFGYAKSALLRRGIAFCELTRASDWPRGPEQVALSTIHSAKGLEFDHILMPGLNAEVTPHGSEDGDGTFESLRRLVAMGIGRARKTVMLGYKSGDRSHLFDVIDRSCYDHIRV